MRCTLAQITRAMNALVQFRKISMPRDAAMQIAHLYTALGNIADPAQVALKEKLAPLIERDENGNFRYEANGMIPVLKEGYDLGYYMLLEEYAAKEEYEIPFERFKCKLPDDISLTPEHIEALEPFLDFGEVS